MVNIYSNTDSTVFLCIAAHQKIKRKAVQQEPGVITRSHTDSDKQLQRAVARRAAFQRVSQKTKSLQLPENEGVFSVSHTIDRTAVLASYRNDGFSVGVDIEKVIISRKVRPFMLDYISRSACTDFINISELWLSTILFCCMESIYKSLSAWQVTTFNINDYKLIHINDTHCKFHLTGGSREAAGNDILCRYYRMTDTVVAISFINSRFRTLDDEISLLNYD